MVHVVVNRGPALPELSPFWQSLLKEAVSFRESLIAGELRADLSQTREEPGETGEAM